MIWKFAMANTVLAATLFAGAANASDRWTPSDDPATSTWPTIADDILAQKIKKRTGLLTDLMGFRSEACGTFNVPKAFQKSANEVGRVCVGWYVTPDDTYLAVDISLPESDGPERYVSPRSELHTIVRVDVAADAEHATLAAEVGRYHENERELQFSVGIDVVEGVRQVRSIEGETAKGMPFSASLSVAYW